MLKRKNITKILLLSVVLVLLISIMTGCASSSVIDTSKKLEDWKADEITFESNDNFVDKILFYIGTFISWITKIMPAHSYILALFVFAIVVEIIMLPFSVMQQKNSRKQAMLRPKEMAIRKKYAGRNDQATQQKVTQEIQELYQKEQFNPMSGCLPLLIQLPIIMALYSIVINPLKYVVGMGGTFTNFVATYMNQNLLDSGNQVANNGSISFISKFKEIIETKGVEVFEGIKDYCANGDVVYGKIEELAETAENMNFNIGPINMGYTPGFNPGDPKLYWLLAIPVLTFVVYFFSSKITRKFSYQPTQSDNPQAGCSNKMMDWMMPLMSVWMTFIVPAAVGIYWMFKSVLNVVKQIIISKVMPLPVFTEEDYKAAEREYMGKQPKRVQKSENAGKVRSLHHIDDEDYDEKGNYIPKVEQAEYIEVTPEENKEPEKLPENNMTEGASLKDESDKGQKHYIKNAKQKLKDVNKSNKNKEEK